MTLQRLVTIMIVLSAGLSTSGCVGLMVGAAATGGVAVAEERTVGTQIDDAAVKIAVSEGLLRYNEDLFHDVGVDVTEGRVLLTGKVKDPQDRVEAVRIAWQQDGVKEVINEIQVTDKGGIGSYLTDVRISSELRADLLLDKQISSINYNVETVGQIVYLTGIALSQEELDRVIAHARTISGVKQVVSHVRIKGSSG